MAISASKLNTFLMFKLPIAFISGIRTKYLDDKKCIVKDDLLVGAVLMGDKNEFAEFKTMIESKTEMADKRNTLLRGASNDVPVLGELVCSCSQVGIGNIEEAIAKGCSDFTELCNKTGAGLGCGSCKTEVREILQNSKVLA